MRSKQHLKFFFCSNNSKSQSLNKDKEAYYYMVNDDKNLDHLNEGAFLVNVIGIVFDTKTKQILIGKRENDQYMPELSWCFPGGTASYEEELDHYLKEEVKTKTNLDVEPIGVIFAKTYPENRKIMSVYYLCGITGGEEKAGDAFSEIKWVDPEELEEHFTTSFHHKLKEYILNLK